MSEQANEAGRLQAEVDHWKAHAEEAGRGFSEVCKSYARVSARNSELVRHVEALIEKWETVRFYEVAAMQLRNSFVSDLREAANPNPPAPEASAGVGEGVESS